MKFAKDTSGIERYLAIDIHREYGLVGGQNARHESQADGDGEAFPKFENDHHKNEKISPENQISIGRFYFQSDVN